MAYSTLDENRKEGRIMSRIESKVKKTIKSHNLVLCEDEFQEAIRQYVEQKFAVKLPKNCYMYYDKAGGGCDNRYETDEVRINWTTEEDGLG